MSWQAPDPACGSIKILQPYPGESYEPIQCERPLDHTGMHRALRTAPAVRNRGNTTIQHQWLNQAENTKEI